MIECKHHIFSTEKNPDYRHCYHCRLPWTEHMARRSQHRDFLNQCPLPDKRYIIDNMQTVRVPCWSSPTPSVLCSLSEAVLNEEDEVPVRIYRYYDGILQFGAAWHAPTRTLFIVDLRQLNDNLLKSRLTAVALLENRMFATLAFLTNCSPADGP